MAVVGVAVLVFSACTGRLGAGPQGGPAGGTDGSPAPSADGGDPSDGGDQDARDAGASVDGAADRPVGGDVRGFDAEADAAPPSDAASDRGAVGPSDASPDAGASGLTYTNVTNASGIAAIIAANKAQYPDWWVSSGQVADLDGDGDLDFFVGHHGNSSATGPSQGAFAATNDGNGHFTKTSFTPTNMFTSEFHLAYDANEDGKLDAIMTFDDGGAQWWTNNTATPDSAFPFTATSVTRDGNTSRLMALFDVNKDGKVDWVRFPISATNTFSFDWGDGTGAFAKNDNQAAVNDGIAKENFFFRPVDLDGDGEIDLAGYVVSYDSPMGVSRILRRGAGLAFDDVTSAWGIPTGAGYSIAGEADVDQDGDMDLLMLENKATLEVYLNDGAGHFAKKPGAISGSGNLSLYLADVGVTMIDLDNDGIGDLLAAGRSFFRIYRGSGGGNFVNVTSAAGVAASGWTSPHFGDIDGDGDMDLMPVVDDGAHVDTFYVYRNDSPNNGWVRVRPVGLAGNRGAAGAKIRVYEPGTSSLISYEQVIIANHYIYYAYPKTERHFGLGKRGQVDVEVEFYPSHKKVKKTAVAAGTVLEVRED